MMKWYSGVMDVGRRGKMVPKGHSQRYCYENKERTYGKEKEQKRKTKKQQKVSWSGRVLWTAGSQKN